MDDIVTTAKRIASLAHSEQVDKSGAPYILHPKRVADKVRANGGTDEMVAAAWCHDCVEDSGVTLGGLLDMGMPWRVVKLVSLLTHKPNEPRDRYYDRVKTDPDAIRIKIADIYDNLSEDRMELLDDKTRERLLNKYEHALDYLGAK